jgi:hypothetical protein
MPRGRRRVTRPVTMPILHPHTAGIDIGATELYVCVPLDRNPQPIRRFGTFTADLLALAACSRSAASPPRPWRPPGSTGDPPGPRS